MEINDIIQLQSYISGKPAVLLYFYNTNCAPCKALKPKVVSMMDNMFPYINVIFVNASQNSQITALFSIFSAPTVIVIFDGKEVIRESKYVSINELQGKIERYYTLFFE